MAHPPPAALTEVAKANLTSLARAIGGKRARTVGLALGTNAAYKKELVLKLNHCFIFQYLQLFNSEAPVSGLSYIQSRTTLE